MTDEKKPEPLAAESVPSVQHGISALASANAPFVYFDSVPSYSSLPGVGAITLTAQRTLAGLPGVESQAASDHVITGLLRGNFIALRSLRDTINKILATVEPEVEAEQPVADEQPSPMLN